MQCLRRERGRDEERERVRERKRAREGGREQEGDRGREGEKDRAELASVVSHIHPERAPSLNTVSQC